MQKDLRPAERRCHHTIPERTETIMISGEILIPRAIIYNKKLTLDRLHLAVRWIHRISEYRDHIDPAAERVKSSSPPTDDRLTPGDHILSLPQVPSKYLQVAKELVDVVYKVGRCLPACWSASEPGAPAKMNPADRACAVPDGDVPTSENFGFCISARRPARPSGN